MKLFKAIVILTTLSLVLTTFPFQEAQAKSDDAIKWGTETLQPSIASNIERFNKSWEKNWNINLSAYLVEGDKEKTLKKLATLRIDIQSSQESIDELKEANKEQKKNLKVIKQNLHDVFTTHDQQVEKVIKVIEQEKKFASTAKYDTKLNKSYSKLDKADEAYAKLQKDLKLDVEKISFNEIVTIDKAEAKEILQKEKAKKEAAAKKKAAEEEKLKIENENKAIAELKKELTDQQAAHKEKTDAFEKEIANLKATNTTLQTEVDSLKSQVSSKSANSTSSGASTQSDTASATNNEPEWFKNCTEMRKKYPNGVASDHPAYASKHDRDKDGYACER